MQDEPTFPELVSLALVLAAAPKTSREPGQVRARHELAAPAAAPPGQKRT